jgi:Uma2 family endonuclease
MAITARRLTYDDLEFIPQEREGDRHELIDGELVVSPVPLDRHQSASSNIVFALETFVRQHRLGRVRTAPSGVRLAHDTLVVPDLYFIVRDRLHLLGEKGMQGPPDLVVEILSPGTRRRDIGLKRELYARFGVAEYWIVDPDAKSVLVLALEEDHYEEISLGEHGAIVFRVLPNLRLTFDEVFAGVS